jgi:hypothetical protein
MSLSGKRTGRRGKPRDVDLRCRFGLDELRRATAHAPTIALLVRRVTRWPAICERETACLRKISSQGLCVLQSAA